MQSYLVVYHNADHPQSWTYDQSSMGFRNMTFLPRPCRQHDNTAKVKRTAVLPRTSHLELPADPRFQHLASRSTAKKEWDVHASKAEDDRGSSNSDSDGKPRQRKARYNHPRINVPWQQEKHCAHPCLI